jgi:hypothetical protein
MSRRNPRSSPCRSAHHPHRGRRTGRIGRRNQRRSRRRYGRHPNHSLSEYSSSPRMRPHPLHSATHAAKQTPKRALLLGLVPIWCIAVMPGMMPLFRLPSTFRLAPATPQRRASSKHHRRSEDGLRLSARPLVRPSTLRVSLPGRVYLSHRTALGQRRIALWRISL